MKFKTLSKNALEKISWKNTKSKINNNCLIRLFFHNSNHSVYLRQTWSMSKFIFRIIKMTTTVKTKKLVAKVYKLTVYDYGRTAFCLILQYLLYPLKCVISFLPQNTLKPCSSLLIFIDFSITINFQNMVRYKKYIYSFCLKLICHCSFAQAHFLKCNFT